MRFFFHSVYQHANIWYLHFNIKMSFSSNSFVKIMKYDIHLPENSHCITTEEDITSSK